MTLYKPFLRVTLMVTACLFWVRILHAQEAPSPSSEGFSQTEKDRDWLTAYMLAHQGYHLHHLDAVSDRINKLSPNQVRTLTDLYKQKHQMTLQSEALSQRIRAQQVAVAEAHLRQQQANMGKFDQLESQAAVIEDHRLNQMHREAFQNSQLNRQLNYRQSNTRVITGLGWGGGGW